MVDQLQHATEALRKALVQVERLKRTNRALLERSYAAALAHGYRWHEFGDVHLLTH